MIECLRDQQIHCRCFGKRGEQTMAALKNIPIFFSTDNNYAPYLGVAIKSIMSNISKSYYCKIHVLTTDLSSKNKSILKKCVGRHGDISFVNVSQQLDKIEDKLYLRDYYTKATYYRFFIADIFPQYDKAIYLDCDVIVNGDIAELYNIELGDSLLAAVPEEVMQEISVFGDYVENVLKIPRTQYFNAGVLVINLKEFRRREIMNEFVALLQKRRFDVTQDQDYLNVIAYKNTVLLGLDWNKTPMPSTSFGNRVPKLVHYKINWKPWHYEGIMYGNLFWQYAIHTTYYKQLLKVLIKYTDADKERDNYSYKELYLLAERQAKDIELSFNKLNA